MVQLINKGGFRERANRSRQYKNSENQQTILQPTQYRNEHLTQSDVKESSQSKHSQHLDLQPLDDNQPNK